MRIQAIPIINLTPTPGISRTNISKVALNADNERPLPLRCTTDLPLGQEVGGNMCSGTWKRGPESPVGVISLYILVRHVLSYQIVWVTAAYSSYTSTINYHVVRRVLSTTIISIHTHPGFIRISRGKWIHEINAQRDRCWIISTERACVTKTN